MEKRSPHYHLSAILQDVAQRGVSAFTLAARNNARLMGLDEAAMLSVVLSMAPRMFYKSMTTLNDHHIWQDVYHVPAPAGKTAYIKVTGYTDERAPVIQFKEK